MESKYLTKKEVAEILGISERTVHRMALAGTIPAVRIGPRLIRFPRAEFEEWEENVRKDLIQAPIHGNVLPLHTGT